MTETVQTDRPTLAVVGAGRCGAAVAAAAHAAGYRVVAVASRSHGSARRLAARVGAGTAPTAVAAARGADITFLTVPDRAVVGVAAALAATGVSLRGRGLVHCSGSQALEALAAARQVAAAVGAVHPLRSLAGDEGAGALRGAHVAVEADAPLRPLLDRLVRDAGATPFRPPAGDRAAYHAAAVLASSAPLALLARSVSLLTAAGVDPGVATGALADLLAGAARNAGRLGVAGALTGPVVRGDAATVERHLAALAGDPGSQRLYAELARETLRLAGPAGRERVAELLGAGAAPAPPPAALLPPPLAARPARSAAAVPA